MKRKRISKTWHDDGRNGFVVVITHHDEGVGNVYRAEKSDGNVELLAWVGTLEEARMRTEERLKATGHLCTGRCQDWIMIPQPEPLSEGEKKTIVACFLRLKLAIETGAPYQHSLAAL